MVWGDHIVTFTRFRERSRDVQDGTERHVWGQQEYQNSAGSIIKVRGTDTNDEEAAVLNIGGVSFNLPKDSNAEVFLLASSSDTTLKMAVLTIPKDKQRRWKEGDGGVQHPTDPEFALDFSNTLAHITKNLFGVGKDGEFEVRKKEIYARVDKMIIDGELIVNKKIKTPIVEQGRQDIPGFQGNEQASSSGGDNSQQGSFDFGIS